ncbi:MAG TPA: YidC/Oxa1 family membrane protein insertase, partial [Bacillota bacterium]|nr:YidC/Oxa1 family membrane protein insertase [Bacillota bacterium]
MHIFSGEFSSSLRLLIQLTGDWSVAILLITLAVKVILLPLAVKQQKAMLMARNLNEVKTILNQRLQNQTDKVNESIAKIVHKYKVNPLLPLFTLLLQAPVVFSLYFTLSN